MQNQMHSIQTKTRSGLVSAVSIGVSFIALGLVAAGLIGINKNKIEFKVETEDKIISISNTDELSEQEKEKKEKLESLASISKQQNDVLAKLEKEEIAKEEIKKEEIKKEQEINEAIIKQEIQPTSRRRRSVVNLPENLDDVETALSDCVVSPSSIDDVVYADSDSLVIAIDSHGYYYYRSSRGIISKVDPYGITSAVYAGSTTSTYTGDRRLATEIALGSISDIAFDSEDNLYIAEYSEHKIRRVDAVTGMMTTLAGTGTAGTTLLERVAARGFPIDGPLGLYIDDEDDVYFTTRSVIHKVDASTRTMTLVAGTGEVSDDCENLEDFFSITDMDMDSEGNIYFTQAYCPNIIKIDAATSEKTIFAGVSEAGYYGDGGLAVDAMFDNLNGIAIDPADNLFISDGRNRRLRKIDIATGIVTAVGGDGTYIYEDGSIISETGFDHSGHFIVHGSGDIYYPSYYEGIHKISCDLFTHNSDNVEEKLTDIITPDNNDEL